jgi:hypothetical protein
MSADELRQAAKVLRYPYRCNTPVYESALANWLDDVAAGWQWDDGQEVLDADGFPLALGESMDSHALKIARLINGGAA